jgi:mitochondrial FAD-linked sulfhydryl oxidase
VEPLPTLHSKSAARSAAMRTGRAWLLAGAVLTLAAAALLSRAPRGAAAPLLARVGLRATEEELRPEVVGKEAPPDKRALGRATWTAFHAVAANMPAEPTDAQQEAAREFVHALTKLYPCPLCREHFDRYVSVRPPDVSSRERFLLWTCEAHNEVSKRNRKPLFPCELKRLDQRWADCGCH